MPWALQVPVGPEIWVLWLPELNKGERPVWKFRGGGQESHQKFLSGAEDHPSSKPSSSVLLVPQHSKGCMELEVELGGRCTSPVSWRMGIWKSCQSLHSDGLSERAALEACGRAWLFSGQRGPFPSTASRWLCWISSFFSGSSLPARPPEPGEWPSLLPLLCFLGLLKKWVIAFPFYFFSLSLMLWETSSLFEKLTSAYCFHPFNWTVVFILHDPAQDTCPSWVFSWRSGSHQLSLCIFSGNLLNHVV